jgi:hypothetical protein
MFLGQFFWVTLSWVSRLNVLYYRTAFATHRKRPWRPHKASWPILQPSQPTSNYMLLPSLVGESGEWVVTPGQAFFTRRSSKRFSPKTVISSVSDQIFPKNRKIKTFLRNGSLRNGSSTTRPKTRATHQQTSEVGGNGRSHGLTKLCLLLGHLGRSLA